MFVPVKGYESILAINKEGQVYHLRTNRRLTPHKDSNGYLIIKPYHNGKREYLLLHRLLALTFLTDEEGSNEVVFVDGDRTNVCLSNLAFKSSVNKRAYLCPTNKSKLTPSQQEEIRSLYHWYSKQYSMSKLASLYGVSACTIHKIIHSKKDS